MKVMVTSVMFHNNRDVKWQTERLFKYYKRTLYTMIPQATLPRALVYPKKRIVNSKMLFYNTM
jgi:hypothetical protein